MNEGYKYEPDMVLLMFTSDNDPRDSARALKRPEKIDQLRLGAERSGFIEAPRTAFRQISVAYNFFEQGVLAKFSAGSDEVSDDAGSQLDQQPLETAERSLGLDPAQKIWGLDDPTELRGWVLAEALLARMRDYVGARGSKLVVVEIPPEAQVAYPELTTTPLPGISERLGVPEIDLLSAFRGHRLRGRERLYLREDKHWTADAHLLAARVVAAQLLQRSLARSGSS